MKNHITIGVYTDDSFKVNIVPDVDLKKHIEFNSTFRPGRMLFVNGKYEVGGVLKSEFKDQKIKEWEEKISKMNIDSSTPSESYV